MLLDRYVLWWACAGHGILFAAWCFLVVFGNVMEAHQMRDISLVCDQNEPCANPALVYSEDGLCCVPPGEGGSHQNAYKVMSVVGGTLASMQLAWFAQKAVNAAFRYAGGVVFVLHRLISGFTFVALFVGVSYVYQYLVYHVFFCHYNSDACVHPAREAFVIRNLFFSLLAVASPYLAVQICRAAALAAVFFTSRDRDLEEVMEIEKKLEPFAGDIEGTFNSQVVAKYRNLRCFAELWMSKNDEDLDKYFSAKAQHMMAQMMLMASPEQSQKYNVPYGTMGVPPGRRDQALNIRETPHGQYLNEAVAVLPLPPFEALHLSSFPLPDNVYAASSNCGSSAAHGGVCSGKDPKTHRLSYREFRLYCWQCMSRTDTSKNTNTNTDEYVNGLWEFLMRYEKQYLGGCHSDQEKQEGDEDSTHTTGDSAQTTTNNVNNIDVPQQYRGQRLTCGGLKEMLYELFFRRKELIHSIYTDHKVITFLSDVAFCVLFPAALIAVSRIWGYQNSFGTGVDLFKTYVLAGSYIISGFKDNVSFMLSMLTDRPFNIGDVLLMDNGNTYKVRRFSLTHVYLDGPHHISVPLLRFASSNTVNLSKQPISDSLRIAFPATTPTSLTNDEQQQQDGNGESKGLKQSYDMRERMYSILRSYQSDNERDISKSSLRCGWVAVPDAGVKVMQCNWRYNFRIFDRSRLNWARTDIRHYILKCLESELGDAFLKIHVAGGGGMNALGERYMNAE